MKLIIKIRDRVKDMTVIQRRLALFIALAVLLGSICLIPILSVKRSNKPLKIAYSSSSGIINPFCEDDSARGVLSLTHISLANMTRSGNYILKREMVESFNGDTYKYKAPADISYEYDEASDTTTYKIKLRSDLKTSVGCITADDIIFTYYVILDPSYSGALRAANADIVGLREYRLNCASASDITKADIDAVLGNIGDEPELAKAITDELIIPTLKRELDAYTELFDAIGAESFEERYGADSPTKLLTGIFGGNPDLLDSELIPAIARLYAGDYRSFSVAYTGSPSLDEYFEPQAERIAEAYLIGKNARSTGDVNDISGIRHIDDLTVAITVYGNDRSALDDLLDIYIAPLKLYGSSDEYDIGSARFGFTRGDISALMKKEITSAAGGAYYFNSRADGITYLSSFDGCYRGKPHVRRLQLVDTDILLYDGSAELDMIMTSDALDRADGYSMVEIATKELVYIGINADRVALDDQGGTYSDKLREAFHVLFSYTLASCDDGEYFRGNSAPVNSVYSAEQGQLSDRAETIAKIKKLLSGAGYVYDDQIGKFTVAAGGGRLEYELLIPEYYQGSAYISSAISEAEKILSELGLTLNITKAVSAKAYTTSIMADRHDLWIGTLDTTYISEYFRTFSESGFVKDHIYGKNHFNYSSELLVGALRAAEDLGSSDASRLFDAIDSSYILIPIGQKKAHLYIKDETVDMSRFPKALTQYYSYADAIDEVRAKR